MTKTLVRLRRDLDLLDYRAGAKPRLSKGESLLLGLSVAASFASPALLSMKVCELLIPSCAAVVATVAVSAPAGLDVVVVAFSVAFGVF